MAAAFDTLSAAKELQSAGFERTQAEAVARAISVGQGNLATKEDIGALRAEIGAVRTELGSQRTELGSLRAELGSQRTELGSQRAELGSLRTELASQRAELGAIKWVLGLVAALNIAILVRLLLI